jgi:hypothetical protein
LAAHRERRRRQAEDSGQRAEESGGQPVTFGITRAAELVGALEKLTAQHADTLSRAITELRAVGDIESAEAEVYAARTSADQRVATAEARLAEEIQRRRDAESERDAARADREQADDATAQAVSRMDDLERELAELRACTEAEVRRTRDTAAAEIRQARVDADRDISANRDDPARQVADAEARAGQAEHHQHALDHLTAATNARITALEETRDALRIRADHRKATLTRPALRTSALFEQLTQATDAEADPEPANTPTPRPRTASRAEKTSATRAARPES